MLLLAIHLRGATLRRMRPLLFIILLLPVLAAAEPKEAELQARLEVLRERKVAADEAIAEQRYRLQQAISIAREVAQKLQQRIATGIPHQRATRLAAVTDAQTALAAESPKQQAAAIRQLLQIYYEELRLLNSVQVSHAMAPVGEEREKHATFIRLGLAANYFLSEDGTAAGIAGPEWRLADSATAAQIADMLEVLRKRQPPKILPVPLP
jgi:hypothetical protein